MLNFHSVYFQILPNQSAYSRLLFQRKCKLKMKRNQLKALCLFIVAAYYIYNTEAAQCYAFLGPDGARQCVKQSGYNDYQWITCRRDSYVRQKTNHKYGCLNPSHFYCLFPCMLEVYGNSGGSVYGSCRCSPTGNIKRKLVSDIYWRMGGGEWGGEISPQIIFENLWMNNYKAITAATGDSCAWSLHHIREL